MSIDKQTRAVELLQELGLKEYESKCFVALTRMAHGTAKEISEVTDVPRTRVYDAIRVLEAKGLVQVQHASPRRYRAIDIEEASSIIAENYSSRIDSLRESLDGLPPVTDDSGSPPVGEIWSLSNDTAITTRSVQLIEDARSEVILVIGDHSAISVELLEALDAAADRDVPVIVGVMTEDLKRRIRDEIPGATVFASGLPWLPIKPESGAIITRLLMVDHETILVGSRHHAGDPEEAEQAVVGTGSSNGIVVILRHLLRSGLLEGSDVERPTEQTSCD